jgi:acetylornithine deacetylase/succinyl-diaminopimelate desuccinylase-like protein
VHDAAEILRPLILADDPAARIRLVAEELAPGGFKVVPSPEGTALLVRGDATLALSGHLDVVPLGGGWDHEQAAVSDGRVWGRGASDMLGSVACFAAAAARTTEPVAILLSTDEETTMAGAKLLRESRALRGYDAILVGEPTDFEIGVAQKGVMWLRVRVRGTSAHASMPHGGVNAIESASRAVLRLRDLPFPDREERERFGPAGQVTLSVDRILGGDAVNVVPSECTFEVDVRYPPAMNPKEILDLIDETIRKSAEVHSLEVFSHHVAFEARPHSNLGQALRRAIGSGGQTPEVLLPYGTEACQYQATDADVVVFGPGERLLAHTNRESIALDDLRRGTEVFARLIEAAA